MQTKKILLYNKIVTKKKTLFLVIGIITGLLVVSGIVLLFLLNTSDGKLGKVEIIENNGAVTIKTEQQSKGYGFTFKFKNDNKEILVNSQLDFLQYNQSLIDLGVIPGEKYLVSVSVNGEISGGNSEFSDEVEWEAKIFLSAPQIYIEEDRLMWNQVENADFYKIHYMVNQQHTSYVVAENQCLLNLLQGGVTNIFVTAESSEKHYLSSISSNVLQNISIVHEMLPVYAVYFNSETKNVVVYSKEKVYMLKVFLEESQTASKGYTITNLNPIKEGDYYRVDFNLDFLYFGQSYLGVAPLPNNEYNSYNGSTFWIKT